MRVKLLIAALAAAGLLVATAARAHHAFAAEFDVNKPLKLEGTLKKWDMVNPHSWFHVDVKGVTWMVEGGSPNALFRRGVTAQSVPPGVELTVEGYQARDGSHTAVGRSFLLGNGERLFLGGSAENIEAPSE